MHERVKRTLYILDFSAAEIQGICEEIKKIRREENEAMVIVHNVTFRQWRNVQSKAQGEENRLRTIDNLLFLNKTPRYYYTMEKLDETEKDYEEEIVEFCYMKAQEGFKVFLWTTSEITREYAQMYKDFFRVIFFQSERQFLKSKPKAKCVRFFRNELFLNHNFKRSDVQVITRGEVYFNPRKIQLQKGDEILLFTLFSKDKEFGILHHFKITRISQENNAEHLAKKYVTLKDDQYLEELESKYIPFVKKCVENRIKKPYL